MLKAGLIQLSSLGMLIFLFATATAQGNTVWVDLKYRGTENGTESQPYNTMAEGLAATANGGVLKVVPGETQETPRINRNMRLEAPLGNVIIGHRPPVITIYLPGDVPLELIKIPRGQFQMGSPDLEQSRTADEGPVHAVTINYDYWIGKTELTQKQWRAVMGSLPPAVTDGAYGAGDDYPVYGVSWSDCQQFIALLNDRLRITAQGLQVRLPSEAEWERACRAETQTRFFFGDSLGCGDTAEDCAAGTLPGNRSDYLWNWFNCQGLTTGDYGCKTTGTSLPNQYGLFDMNGNVLEWCEDDWHGDYTNAPINGSAWVDSPRGVSRVVRGGLWVGAAADCRAANRYYGWPNHRIGTFGCRLGSVQ